MMDIVHYLFSTTVPDFADDFCFGFPLFQMVSFVVSIYSFSSHLQENFPLPVEMNDCKYSREGSIILLLMHRSRTQRIWILFPAPVQILCNFNISFHLSTFISLPVKEDNNLFILNPYMFQL